MHRWTQRVEGEYRERIITEDNELGGLGSCIREVEMRSAFTPLVAVHLGTVALLAGAATQAHGQATTPQTKCDGRTVHDIRVTALRPPFTGEAKYWRRIAR